MPIPDDPDECVSFLIDEGKSRKQAIAICAERQSMSKNCINQIILYQFVADKLKGISLSTTQLSIGDWSIHVFDTQEDAEACSAKLGIEGFHEHEIDGATKFMPGPDHDAYNEAVDLTSLDEAISSGDIQLAGAKKKKKKKKSSAGKVKSLYEITKLAHLPEETDSDTETSASKDRRMRIREDDEGFTFLIYDDAGFSFSESKIGEGVKILYQSENRWVSAFHFAKPEFSFDEVRQYLIANFFDPSDLREESFEMHNGAERMVFLENVAAQNPKIQTYNTFEDLDGAEWLRAEAIAIAPGIWKEFTFTNEVLHQHVEKFKDVNVCEHHSFFEPGDVKGRTLSSEAVDEGIKISFVVFDKDSIRKIQSEFFHSVSSNFLLTVDENNNVIDIGKVIEETLTDNPACLDAVITMNEPVKIDEFVKVAAEADVLETASTVAFSKSPNIPPPVVGGNGGKMSEKTEPEQTSASMEVTKELQAELQETRKAMKDINAKLEDEVKARVKAEEQNIKLEATKTVKFLVEEAKTVPPAIREEFEAFYLTLDAEKKEALSTMLKKAPQVLPTEDTGVPLIDDGGKEAQFESRGELDENSMAFLLQNERARRQEGANLYSKEQFQWHRGLYDRDMSGPVIFDTDGAVLKKQQEQG